MCATAVPAIAKSNKKAKNNLKENFNSIKKLIEINQEAFSCPYLKISLKCQVLASNLKDKTTLKVTKERQIKQIMKWKREWSMENRNQKIVLGSDFVTNVISPFLFSLYIKIR